MDALGEQTVTLTFGSEDPFELDSVLALKVYDSEELLGAHQETNVKVKAEAYEIELDVNTPARKARATEASEAPSGIDFGLVKAVEEAKKQIALANTGKHAVAHKFHARTQSTRELFHIEPSEGEIEPGAEATVDFHFNKDGKLRREATLVNNVDVSLSVSEPATGAKHEKIPIRTSIRAVFAKYALTPKRGLSFGPLTYNNTSDPRAFEISNTGEFPFAFNLFNYGESESRERDEGGQPRASAEDDGRYAPARQLRDVAPAGTVEPGEKATVEVTFTAENDP